MLRERQYAPRWQWLLYVALLGLTVAAMVMLSRCDRPMSPAGDHASGGDTLDIAIEYSPVTYYCYDDTIGGFDHDLLRLISARAHRPMKFHPIVTLSKGLAGLRDSTYDVLVAQYPMTAAGRRNYLFTDPIYIDNQVLVQHSSTGLRRQFELAGDTVWVVKGSPMKERIEGLSREMGDTIHVMADPRHSAEQLLLRVASGEIKFAVVNRGIARVVCSRLTDLDCSVDISMSQFQSWVLHKDNHTLCDSLNLWLKQAKGDKKNFDQLNARYF